MTTQRNFTPFNKKHAINHAYRTLVVAGLFGLQIAGTAAAVDDDYVADSLWHPSEAVLLAEHRGRVTIFDGLDSHVVDQALDEQFDRIGRMMFVRTRYPQPDGSVESDDDCD